MMLGGVHVQFYIEAVNVPMNTSLVMSRCILVIVVFGDTKQVLAVRYVGLLTT